MARALSSTAMPRASFKLYELRREAVESFIEQRNELLDTMDGDENLEPYLADTRGWFGGSADDREGDLDEDEGDDRCDDEHNGDVEESLGWANPMGLRMHIPEERAAMMSGFDGWE